MVIDGSEFLVLVEEIVSYTGLLLISAELTIQLLLQLTLTDIDDALLHGRQVIRENICSTSLNK